MKTHCLHLKSFIVAPILLSMFLLSAPTVGAQQPLIEEEQGVTGFGLALRKLPKTGSLLYITAHPDDENNALLAKLSRGEGYRVGLLTVTRGDGGQNEIGPELFEALGILRSEELMTAHRYDGVEQYFTRAFEFGYSFSVEETFQKWGREEILGDVVRVIRQFRPQVLLAMNPSGAGGGQHHQASGRLAIEAFRIAGDATRYPEQLEEGLRPWKPLRLFHTTRVGMGDDRGGGDLQIQLDEYDPLLGETYVQFGGKARNRHRSQGMNVLPEPDPMISSFVLANSVVDSSDIEESFFDQIDVSLESLSRFDPGLESSILLLEGYLDWASEAYSRADYVSAVKAVMTGLGFVRRMKSSTEDPEALFLLEKKEADFQKAAERGHYIYADALATGISDGLVTRGEEFHVRVRFQHRAEVPVQLQSVEIAASPGWEIEEVSSNESNHQFKIRVPEDAAYSQPYWQKLPNVDRFEVKPGYTGIEPYAPPPLTARISYSSFGVTSSIEQPVQFRWYNAAAGQEERMALKVVPRLSVTLSPDVSILKVNDPGPVTFKASVTNLESNESRGVELSLAAPRGWRVSPSSSSLDFTFENQIATQEFVVTPAASVSHGRYEVEAVAGLGDQTFRSGFHEIAYPHIENRLIYEPSRSTVEAFEVRLPSDLKIGYVMGVGDEVDRATEQLGAQVTYLTAEDLSSGDLDQYDAIVTGVRAYLVREDLVTNNQRLLDYVRRGGHLVVQYNKYEFLREQFTPYPVTIHRPHDRVTVEESPVQILRPEHPVFRTPNRIRTSDWQGWVQERGLYFLGEWDENFVPLLELRDPWPYNQEPKRGSLMFARYGEGTYIYTGLAFFRQLPAGVPGAYRLWANLIAMGASR